GSVIRSSSALWSLLRADGTSGSSHRCVQCHGGANERLQRLFIKLLALMEIDGTPGVAFEAGVEEAARVLQRGALGKGHLHHSLVRLTGADHSGVRPHRNPSPLPLLDHFGVGLLDETSDPSERLAPPITQLLDSRIDQLRGRLAFRLIADLLHVVSSIPSICARLAALRTMAENLATVAVGPVTGLFRQLRSRRTDFSRPNVASPCSCPAPRSARILVFQTWIAGHGSGSRHFPQVRCGDTP